MIGTNTFAMIVCRAKSNGKHLSGKSACVDSQVGLPAFHYSDGGCLDDPPYVTFMPGRYLSCKVP